MNFWSSDNVFVCARQMHITCLSKHRQGEWFAVYGFKLLWHEAEFDVMVPVRETHFCFRYGTLNTKLSGSSPGLVLCLESLPLHRTGDWTGGCGCHG